MQKNAMRAPHSVSALPDRVPARRRQSATIPGVGHSSDDPWKIGKDSPESNAIVRATWHQANRQDHTH